MVVVVNTCKAVGDVAVAPLIIMVMMMMMTLMMTMILMMMMMGKKTAGQDETQLWTEGSMGWDINSLAGDNGGGHGDDHDDDDDNVDNGFDDYDDLDDDDGPRDGEWWGVMVGFPQGTFAKCKCSEDAHCDDEDGIDYQQMRI